MNCLQIRNLFMSMWGIPGNLQEHSGIRSRPWGTGSRAYYNKTYEKAINFKILYEIG